MARLNVENLRPGTDVTGTFLVREASLRTTRAGKPYIKCTLADATGTVTGMLWDATEAVFAAFQAGAYVKVRGRVETYQDEMQIVIAQSKPVDASDVDAADFLPATRADVKALLEELDACVARVKDGPLRALLESFFEDAAFRERFSAAPAAMRNHHAYLGGLLEHTVSVARLVERLLAERPELDAPLLRAGALLHDVGKVEELSAGPALDYTDAGRLLGHVALGALMAEERMARVKGFPGRTRLVLLHLLLAHHGRREFGSPVLPATAEAMALHHLDNLDAKVAAAAHFAGSAPGDRENWTEYIPMFEGRLYTGSREGADASA